VDQSKGDIKQMTIVRIFLGIIVLCIGFAVIFGGMALIVLSLIEWHHIGYVVLGFLALPIGLTISIGGASFVLNA
jgi:hypothetical protein